MYPANYAGIRNAAETLTAEQLCQYVHCPAWMRSAIHSFSECAAPFYKILEVAFKNVGRCTNRAIRKLNLCDLGCTKIHSNTFVGFQQKLQNVTETAHRDPILRVCVQGDARHASWAAAVTQCDEGELKNQS